MKFVDVMTVGGLLVGRKAVVIRFGSSVATANFKSEKRKRPILPG